MTTPPDEVFYAHSHDGHPPGPTWQTLAEHLRGVARRAKQLAEAARPGDFAFHEAARVAGLLHDLGKYQPAWQRYLRLSAAGCPADGVPHAVHGAFAAVGELEQGAGDGWPVAWAVHGHHAGMPDHDCASNDYEVAEPTLGPLVRSLLASARAELLEYPTAAPPLPFPIDGADAQRRQELWARFLFSALVDADRLDTERFATGHERSPVALDPGPMLDLLDAERRRRTGERTDHLTRLRNEVFERCVVAGGESEQGFFDLTVPTGGGKTFSGMAFALAHAKRHGLRRVIVVIPYLSIIEQNAGEYKSLFGPERVLEHHSAVAESGPAGEGTKRTAAELATENWDAPVVVTTNVQFLETLLESSPRRCRKLHNVARSVVVFDEAQALPAHLLNPLLGVFRELVRDFGVSVVLSTATQPAFRRAGGLTDGLRPGELRPVLPEGLRDELFRRLRRVSYRVELGTPWDWDTLAARLLEGPTLQGLCVLNTRRHAREVWNKVRERVGDKGGVFHLSSAMCAQHRADVLGTRKDPAPESVRGRLKAGKSCFLVSTQVIEAGVDVSFPRVFRALGPLDSVVQVAGRCNREGELLPDLGEVFVFGPAESGIPPGMYARAAGLCQDFLSGRINCEELAANAGVFAEYFAELYAREESDAGGLRELRAAFQFREVAAGASVIADGGRPVIVPYKRSKKLIRTIRRLGRFGRRELRSLQRYTVNLRAGDYQALLRYGQLIPLLVGEGADGPMVLDTASYDKNLGVVVNGVPSSDFVV